MQIASFEIPEVKRVTPRRFGGDRGLFEEICNERRYQNGAAAARFMHDDHCASERAVRGLHYPAPPFAQAKLVGVLQGSILDDAADARRGSSTYRKQVKAELSAGNGVQIIVPAGFLNGLITVEPDTPVTYRVDGYCSADAEGSIRFDDPDLAVDWGLNAANAVLSDQDSKAPTWASFETPFLYSHA